MSISDYIDIKDITTQIVMLAFTGAGGFMTYYFGFRKNSDSNKLIQFTPEQYERSIKLERNDAVEEYKKANTDSEKVVPLRKITEFDNRLADMPKAFKEALEIIRNGVKIVQFIFNHLGEEVGIEKLIATRNALEKGDFSKADKLFAEIELHKELSIDELRHIATARGKISEHDIRWHDAFNHYTRAAKIAPCFDTLSMAQRLALAIGNDDSALSLGIDAQKAAIKEHGDDSDQYANSINNLSGIYLEKGDYKKAEKILNEVIKIKKRMFGENHIETATGLNNIAMVYQKQELYDKAENILKEVLEIHTEAFGENHHQTADALNNLAGIYQKLGQYEKAEELHNKALTIRRQTLKKNHPSIANSLYNLARVYQRQGRHQESEPLCKEALKIVETTLGPDHHHTKLVKTNYEDLQKHLANAENDEPQ